MRELLKLPIHLLYHFQGMRHLLLEVLLLLLLLLSILR